MPSLLPFRLPPSHPSLYGSVRIKQWLLCFMSVFVYVFRVSVVFRVYVCLICENPGIDVVLTRAAFLLWSVGDRHRRVRYGGPISIQGHTCKAPFGVHDIDLSSTTVRSTTVLGRYMHVPPSGRGSGAARRLTPRSVRSRQRGFELTAGLGQSTLCSASNPCPLTYHFVVEGL